MPHPFLLAFGLLGWAILGQGTAQARVGEQVPAATVLALVGSEVVDRSQLEVRVRVNEIRGADSTRAGALAELLAEGLEREIGRRLGAEPSEADLAEFQHHAARTSQAPEQLRAIRALFGADEAGFRRHLLAPRAQRLWIRAALAQRAAGQSERELEESYRKAAAGIAVVFRDRELRAAVCVNHGGAWFLQESCALRELGAEAASRE